MVKGHYFDFTYFLYLRKPKAFLKESVASLADSGHSFMQMLVIHDALIKAHHQRAVGDHKADLSRGSMHATSFKNVPVSNIEDFG